MPVLGLSGVVTAGETPLLHLLRMFGGNERLFQGHGARKDTLPMDPTPSCSLALAPPTSRVGAGAFMKHLNYGGVQEDSRVSTVVWLRKSWGIEFAGCSVEFSPKHFRHSLTLGPPTDSGQGHGLLRKTAAPGNIVPMKSSTSRLYLGPCVGEA